MSAGGKNAGGIHAGGINAGPPDGSGCQGDRPITVGIVDDHQVLADAMRMAIESQPDMRVVGVAGSCAQALALVRQRFPLVLLLDVALPDGDGIRLVPQIKQDSPCTGILILTSLTEEAVLLRAMQAGASGFLSKSQGLASVFKAVRAAADEEIGMPASVLLGLLNRAQPAAPCPLPPPALLSEREREILVLLACGKSGAAIASELVITPHTVRTHIRNLMGKLGAHSRLQAVAEAVRLGLIDPPA